MEKMIQITLWGKTYWLHFSIGVMLEMQEKFGTLQDALNLIPTQTKDGVNATAWFAAKMSEAAELCRRAEGQDHGPILTEDMPFLTIAPKAFVELQNSIIEAIGIGYRTEVTGESKEEVDLGLQELQKKTEPVE